MNGLMTKIRLDSLTFPLLALLLASPMALAQVPVDENGNPIASIDDGGTVAAAPGSTVDATLLGAAELEELVGPVALYPDDLLAIVLPASTYPLEIVQAARFLEEQKTDSSLKPDESWDDSVVALLNYPEVIQMMNEDIDWTWRLGEAVIAQQGDVITAVESFRDRAYAAGNLKSDDRQTVTVDDGAIEIAPVDEEIIYVPYYEPEEVVVYQPVRRVYYYYPDPYPVYYYPYPLGYQFSSGFFWGVTTAFHIGWHNHYLHVYHPSYWGHPYYGYNYVDYYWYRRPSITVYNTWYVNNSYRTSNYRYRDGDYWRPRYRAGSRPDEPRVRNYYYPPNSSERSSSYSRNDTRVSNRDRLQVRDDGRMNLNLRERSGTPVRPDNRATANNGRTNRVDGSRNDGRAVTASRDNGNSRSTTGGSRLAANRNNERTVSRNGNSDGGRSTSTGGRRTEGFTASNNESRSSAGRGNSSRPEIRFRDRSNDGASTNNRSITRPSAGSSGRSTASSRQAPTAQGNGSFAGRVASGTQNRTTIRNGDSSRRNTATQTIRPSASTGRSTGSSVRPSAPSRPSASAPRSSAPSYSAPSRSAAPTRSAPPRSSAPARSAPSRASAPSRSAPAAPSGSRSSGRSGSGSERRSSSRSRDRN